MAVENRSYSAHRGVFTVCNAYDNYIIKGGR